MRIIKDDVAKAKVIVSNPNIQFRKVISSFNGAIAKIRDVKDKMIEQFHQPNNAEMHQKV